ncbi:Histidinol dehydrogenase [Lachnospiraceae bacterium TWA4]|nr:Histidinol dehydrogenase [Lachnospiraceae bacterium TWA4]
MRIYKNAERKTYERDQQTTDLVADILKNVATNGDAELIDLAKKFDNIELDTVKVDRKAVEEAYKKVSKETVEAIQNAAAQIRFFAEKQLETLKPLTTASPIPGVTLGHRLIPVETVGAYVPAGRYPLPSTALMLAIPAKVAGVKKVVACSPAARGCDGIHPAVLVAMDIAGVDEIFCSGGAQAVAAMAYGTESIPRVDLICGPGNRYVVEAKRQVLGSVGIDSLAGPSEVLIIADDFANPDYTAIDLLAQSEHDSVARSTLLCLSEDFGKKVEESLEKFASELPTGELAMQTWKDNGMIIVCDNMEEAIALANDNAPEHLEVHTINAQTVANELTNFGSLFVGEYTPVAFGDYCSGTNHTLPTMASAKYSSGLWVGTFLKTAFTQYISKEGCQNLSKTCATLAGEEGLSAHQKSVLVRVGK